MFTKNYALMFDFAHDKKDLHAFFTNPIDVITTTVPEKISDCLHKVDLAINQGNFVAGFIAYEAAEKNYPSITQQNDRDFPLLWFGVFKNIQSKPNHFNANLQKFNTSTWSPNVSIHEYNKAFASIQAKINNGVTDQVNYTIQMNAHFNGNDYTYYEQLKKAQEANYSAYLSIDRYSILSVSPELFFHINKGKITTRPMKGTAKRGNSYVEDKQSASWLKNSIKNRKENKLAVELMKKELNKITKPNTIKVPRKFEIEQYPTVYQMTSTVTATLKENMTTEQIFDALFPCSSITGSPKYATMSIINTYEKSPRNIYCGAIGYFTPEKEAIFNVPIRTVLIDRQKAKATYGVGGAIMADSTMKEEYDEVLTKVKVLTEKQPTFKLLETIALIDGEYIVLANHFKRLAQSAEYFNFPYNESILKESLDKIARDYPKGEFILRVLLHKDGHLSIERHYLMNNFINNLVTLADKPIKIDTPFIYHKTTERSIYEDHIKSDVFDVLLWNEKGEITEFTKGNIVIEQSGEMFTPPLASGLLPGTYRQSLLDKGTIKEKILTKDDLNACEKIYFINSVRRWVEVEVI